MATSKCRGTVQVLTSIFSYSNSTCQDSRLPKAWRSIFFLFFFVTQIRSFLSLSFVVSVCMGELMIWKGSNDPSQRWRNFFFFAANATRLRLANGFRSARSIFFWFVQPLRRRNLLRVESSEVLHGGPP